jgi:hypothetical protein
MKKLSFASRLVGRSRPRSTRLRMLVVGLGLVVWAALLPAGATPPQPPQRPLPTSQLQHQALISSAPVAFAAVPLALPSVGRFSASSSEECWQVHPGVNPKWQEKSYAGNNLYHIDFYLAWCETTNKSRITRWLDRNCWGHPDMEEIRSDGCSVWTGSAGYSSAPLEVDWSLHAEYQCPDPNGNVHTCYQYYSPYASGTVHADPPSVTGTVYFN